MSTVCGALTSRLLGEELSYRAILPRSYDNSKRRYPVLYLLHGLFGSFENWTELTKVAELVDRCEFIVVTPEGRDGWYVDSETVIDHRFESYIIDEMIPEAESRFRIDARREHRAIAGNSMGGYGAIKFALKYPTRFAFAGSFSGAFEAPTFSDEHPGTSWDEFRPSLMAAFGPDASSVRSENDLFSLIDGLSAEDISELPRIYMDCGTEDEFITVNRRMSNAMAAKGIRHEFEEVPGGHDWEYWDSRLPNLFEKLTQLPGWQANEADASSVL